MAVDGSLNFDTKIDTTGFNKGANTIKSQADGMKSTFASLGRTMAVVFSVAALVKFGKQAIDTASDLQEVQNVVDTAFGSMSYKMEDFAKTSIEMFGISKLAAKQTGSVFMAMGVGMGIAQSSASDMSIALTGLSADMSSFYNVSQEVASTALKSIYTGETETLKQYGIVMTEANLQQYALTQGITKSIQSMSQAEKVQLRYNFVMAQTALAQGDFAKTSNSWANQTRILSQQWQEFLGILGTGLIQVLSPVVKMLNGMMSYLISFANSATKVLASIFNIKTASTGAAAAVTDISTGAEGASTGLDNVGKSAEKASKKAKKSTAGIDELNVLTSDIADNAENASGALGGMGGTGDYGMNITPTVEKADTSNFDSSISELTKGLMELALQAADSFKKGFETGIGDVNFDSIMDHVDGIKTSLQDIFTDSKVASAAKEWVLNTANSLGEITGSMASIGLTVAELFVGSIDKYLSQNNQFIKDKIVSLFNLSSRSGEIYSNYAVALADIFTVFRGDKAKQIGADLIAIFTNGFLSVAELGLKFGTDLMAAITKPIIENKDKIKTAINNTLSPISTVVGGIKDFVNGAFQSINGSYESYVAPALEKFSSGFGTVFSSLLDAYNQYFAPTFDSIATKISEVMNGPVGEMVQKFTDLVGIIVDGMATVWDKTLAPFLAWLIDTFSPMWAKYIGGLADKFLSAITTISNLVGDLLTVLGGLKTFVTGVFTGDWNKAWNGIATSFGGVIQGIKDIVAPIATYFTTKFTSAYTGVKNSFSGVKSWFQTRYNEITGIFVNIPTWFKTKFTEAWTNVKNVFSTGGKVFDGIKEGIAETFKTVVNGLIGGINKVLSIPFAKINSALSTLKSFSIPGIGKPFSGLPAIDMPQIPKLATGTVVPANYGEFTAILGDNKREAEVVSPLSTMKQAFREALKESGGGSGGNINLTVNLDGQTVYQTVVKYNSRNTRITGKNAFAQ